MTSVGNVVGPLVEMTITVSSEVLDITTETTDDNKVGTEGDILMAFVSWDVEWLWKVY